MSATLRLGSIAACLLAVVGATLQLGGPTRLAVQVVAALAAVLVLLLDRQRRAAGAAEAPAKPEATKKSARRRFERPITRVWTRLAAIGEHLQSHDDQLAAQRELTRRLKERLDQQEAESRKTQVFFEERLYAIEEGRLAELAQLRELREQQHDRVLRLQASLDIHKRELAAFEGALRLRDDDLSTLANVRVAADEPLRATAG